MSCRTTPAGSAWTTFARLESGLSDVQTLSAFHALRRDGRGTPAPHEKEWAGFVEDQRAEMEAAGFRTTRVASLNRRLDRAAENVPDGATWFALRNIRARATANAQNVSSLLTRYASESGEDVAVVRERYERYLDDVDRGRSVVVPEGYSDARNQLASAGLPLDHGSYQAMNRIAAEAALARSDQNPVRRIERVEFPNSEGVHSAGYDAEGGRLEIVFRRRGEMETSRVYAYQGVPASTWERMQEGSPGVVYNAEIRNRTEYRYASVEAEEADATRRCGGCGQWRGASHQCPTRAAAPVTAPPVTAPVAVAPVVESPAGEATPVAVVVDAPAEPLTSTAVEPEPAAEAPAPAEPDVAQPEVVQPDVQPAAEPVVTAPAVAEPEVPARPAPVAAHLAGIYSRSQYNRRRGESHNTASARDIVSLTPVMATRAAAVNQPLIIPVNYSARRHVYEGERWQYRRFAVSGDVIYDRPGRGQHVVTPRDLQCTCATYRETYSCEHIDLVLERYRSHLIPAAATPRTPVSEEVAAARAAAAQQVAEAAMRADWTRNEETAAEARARWAQAAPEETYSENFAAFEEDHQGALRRRAAGEGVIPFMTSNATNGMLSRESGRGFGVELEFDFPSTFSQEQKNDAMVAIGADLHTEGLTPQASQTYYGAARRNGYTDQQAGGWSYERDCTVSGEIVSPVMYDEPEAWENLQKVCTILERHGAVASARTGSHVHVSMPDTTNQTASELAHMVNIHEDVMYRISQNPERSAHRPLRWCGPNRDVPQGGYDSVSRARMNTNGHGYGLNYQSVSGSSSDHVEIRHWDGTLNAATIQTQVKVSAALVAAAERNGSVSGGVARRTREPVGSHARRLAAVKGRSRRALTSQELAEDSATTRSFIDTLFTRREDKAQVAALFAITKWTKAPGSR